MISAGDFRNGVTIELEGNIYQIIEFQHVKPGKGAAFVRTKLKNIVSGGVVEKTFRPALTESPAAKYAKSFFHKHLCNKKTDKTKCHHKNKQHWFFYMQMHGI